MFVLILLLNPTLVSNIWDLFHRGPTQMERLLMLKIIKDCMGKPKHSYYHKLKRRIFTFMFKINEVTSIVVICRAYSSKWQILAIYWVLLHIIRGEQGRKLVFRLVQRRADFHLQIPMAQHPKHASVKLSYQGFFLYNSIQNPSKTQSVSR